LGEIESGFQAAEAFLRHDAHSLKNFRCIVSTNLADLFGTWIGCSGGRDVPSIELRIK
jgi:hypothetical protein